jgi:hypothetical protein
VKARKAKGRPDVKALHFCEIDRDLPIAGTPAPKPCPFCGKTDVAILFGDRESPHAHVECQHCGAEAPFACETEDGKVKGSFGLALEAARLWNDRKS